MRAFIFALRSFSTTIFLPVYVLLASSQPLCFGCVDFVPAVSWGGWDRLVLLHNSAFCMEKYSLVLNRDAYYRETNEPFLEAQRGGLLLSSLCDNWSNIDNKPPLDFVYKI